MYPSRKSRLERQRKTKRNPLGISRVWVSLIITAVAIAGGLFISLPHLLDRFEPPPEKTNVSDEQPPPPSESSVTLSFVGDVMMSGRVEALLREKSFAYPFVHTRSLFQQDTLTIANLETPITLKGTPAANKEYVYKSPPEALDAMKKAGIDLVNLANNHSMDQGVDGLLDTMTALKEREIAYVGAGEDDTQAFAPVIIERNDMKLAFIGVSRVIPEVSWYAGTNKPGVAATYDPARVLQAISKAKTSADLVVVIAHWGKEREQQAADYQKTLARQYIDAGATLVIGGHPHVLQGIEAYGDGWIAYSLGNFIFTRSQTPQTWETMILQASCSKNKPCALTMQPYHAELGQAVPMNAEQGEALRKRLEKLSPGVQIDQDGTITSTSDSKVKLPNQ